MITLIDHYTHHNFPKAIYEFVHRVYKTWPGCNVFYCDTLIALRGLKEKGFTEEAERLGFVTRKLHLWRTEHTEFQPEKDEVIWMYEDNRSRPIEDDEFLIWDEYNSH
jgi:hypothetical protein